MISMQVSIGMLLMFELAIVFLKLAGQPTEVRVGFS